MDLRCNTARGITMVNLVIQLSGTGHSAITPRAGASLLCSQSAHFAGASPSFRGSLPGRPIAVGVAGVRGSHLSGARAGGGVQHRRLTLPGWIRAVGCIDPRIPRGGAQEAAAFSGP